MSAKLYEDIGYHGRIQTITFLGNRPGFKKMWHFEILTWESMGKPKMWNISKKSNRRAKGTKKWDSMYYISHMEGTVDARFLEFGLGSFGALCKIFNFPIFKTLFLSQFPPNFIQCILIIGQYRLLLFGDLPKFLNIRHFEVFLNTGQYAAGKFKVLFLLQFSLDPNQTLWEPW